MKVILVDSNFNQEQLEIFCQNSISDTEMKATVNMDFENWQEKPHTLLHAVFIQKRFDHNNRAAYFLLDKENKYIAGSGCYPLSDNPNICIVVSRGYTVKEERGHWYHGKYLLPRQLELAQEHGYKTAIITVNEYNQWFKKGVEKLSNGKSLIGNRVPEVYRGWSTLPFPVTIQHTKQWCLYKHLDDKYDNEFHNTMAQLRTD